MYHLDVDGGVNRWSTLKTRGCHANVAGVPVEGYVPAATLKYLVAANDRMYSEFGSFF